MNTAQQAELLKGDRAAVTSAIRTISSHLVEQQLRSEMANEAALGARPAKMGITQHQLANLFESRQVQNHGLAHGHAKKGGASACSFAEDCPLRPAPLSC